MAKHFQILPLTQLPTDIEALRIEADREGYRFLDRLVRDWIAGHRFELAGERLLGAFSGETLIGLGGLSRDPYTKAEKIGRIRHLYILRAERRHGVGSALVERLLEEAHASFASSACERIRPPLSTCGTDLFPSQTKRRHM